MKVTNKAQVEQQLREIRQRTDQNLLDTLAKKSKGGITSGTVDTPEKIDISLGKAIHTELDIEKLVEERKAKIESIKERIKNNSYNPSSTAVAESLARELGFEIATSKRFEE